MRLPFVSRRKHEALRASYKACENAHGQCHLLKASTKDELQCRISTLTARIGILESDNEALLRFVGAVKASTERLGREFAEPAT